MASETDGAAQTPAAEPSDAGSRLRRAREAQGLTIEDLAHELRFTPAALDALEENRFEALGAAVFAKGYLRQYGARLGLDVRELLAQYEQVAGPQEHVLSAKRPIRIRDERQIGLWVVASFALVLVAVFLSLWWLRPMELWPFGAAASRESGPTGSAADPAAAAALAPEAAPGDAGTAVTRDATSEVRPPAAGDEGDVAAPPETDAAAPPETDAAAPPETDAAAPPETDAASPAGFVAADAPAEALPIEGPVLEVVFAEDSWTEIADEDGSRLYYGLGRAGTAARFPADRNLNLTFGNASGVVLRIDGEPVQVPGANRRNVASFDLDDLAD